MIRTTFISRTADGNILCETPQESLSDISYMQAYNHAKSFLKTMATQPESRSVRFQENYLFHYISSDGITYLAICEKNYAQPLAFAYLEQVKEAFIAELKKVYGSLAVDYRSHIETIDKPFAFIKFDKEIQKKKEQFMDSNNASKLQKLNSELAAVNKILVEDFELMMDRDKNLSRMGEMASDIKNKSKEVFFDMNIKI